MAKNTVTKVKFNFIFGIVGQAITLLIGIIVPRLFITSFGSDVNGYINSINQILVYVALLEAGVGTASLQALYATIATNDKAKINGILAATNKFYTRTAFMYLGIVVVLSFVYPLFLDSPLSYPLMVGIFFLTGGSGAVPYFCHAKYKLLLTVDGTSYVTTIITTVYQVSLSLGKAVLLLLGCNVIIVQSLYIILNILQAIVFAAYIKKKYNWVDLKVEPDMAAISKSKSVIVHQFSGLIFNNTDILILTFFCDLKSVSIYVLYKNFISMISTLLNTFFNSIKFKLGQTFQDRERFIKLFDVYETFHVSITFSLCTIAYVCLTPFMQLYTAGMDINYMIPHLPLLMIIMEILNYGRMPSMDIITYSGLFSETRWRSILETVINLVSSLILVNFMGINGVVIGTILALLYRTNDMIIYGNKHILKRSVWPVYRTWIVNIAMSLLTVFLFNSLNLELNNYIVIILTAAVLCVIVVPLQITVSYLFNKNATQAVVELVKSFLSKKQKNGDK